MNELLILRGIPASGKSTFAIQLMLQHKNKFKRINRDSLRLSILGNINYDSKNESLIRKIKDNIIKLSFQNGFDVISDDTNMDSATVKHLHKIAEEVGDVIVREIYFNIDVNTAINRDKNREFSVGEKVIRYFFDTFSKNIKVTEYTEYHKKISVIKKQDESLPKAILCDIDGTIAKMNNKRGPFEIEKIGLDDVNKPVEHLIKTILTCNNYCDKEDFIKIIFFSGRDGSCKNETIKWFKDNLDNTRLNIEYENNLFMRSAGDMRKDSIVKKEMYEKFINDKYNVLFVLDDRNQVIDMWRKEIGLPCFQVDYGNF